MFGLPIKQELFCIRLFIAGNVELNLSRVNRNLEY